MDDGDLPGQKDGDLCRVHIPLHSKGIWEEVKEEKIILSHPLPRLQLQLAAIFLVAQSLHLLLRRFHLPRIVPEILAGIILGPTFLGQIPYFTDTFFPEEGEVFIQSLSKIGFVFFMFLIGVKMDPSIASKTGKKAWTIGVFSVVLPVLFGLGMSSVLDPMVIVYRRPALRSVIGVQTLTPFAVVACLLIDLKIMNSELGRLALASALISDLLSTIVSTLLSIVRLGFAGWTSALLLKSLLFTVAFIVIIVFVMRPALLWIIRQTPEGKPVNGGYIVVIAATVMMLAIVSDNLGLQYQLGPFILGLSVPDGPPLGSTLVERLDSLTTGLLAPLLLAQCGLKVNLWAVYDKSFMFLIWIVFVVSAVLKAVATLIPAYLCNVPNKDAFALSVIMNAQGIVEMSSYLNNFVGQTIDNEIFAVAIMSVLVMAIVSTVLERLIYDYSKLYRGYQKRNIVHLPYNAELRILACAHRQDDAMAALKVLEASNPSKESPVGAYALNLVELLGRASPLLINHDLGQRASYGGTRSQQMIDIFRYYESQHPGSVNVHVFSSISLPRFMHHDVCSLALDKLASMIILPFHKKWNYQGQVVFHSTVIRAVNLQVLDLAPCSVGILIDRRKLRRTSPAPSLYHVAVIFLGGDDDRESLAYAKRMAKSSGVHLTVIRMVALEDSVGGEWEFMLDSESLKELRLQSSQPGNVVYREEKVRDGPDTAMRVHAMVDHGFDLILAGRRHRENLPQLSGITEWIELPELGPIGDILSSADIDKPVSAIVVQQQLVQVN